MGCNIRGAQTYGIRLAGCVGAQVIGCRIDDCPVGIRIQDGGEQDLSQFIVSDNYITGFTTGISVNGGESGVIANPGL